MKLKSKISSSLEDDRTLKNILSRELYANKMIYSQKHLHCLLWNVGYFI